MRAYSVYGQDNDSYAFRDYPPVTENQRIYQEIAPDMSAASRPELRRCKACGEILDKWAEPLSNLVVKKRKYDIGSTYDGMTIVTTRFKDAYEAASLSGLEFRQLPNDAGFFAIRPHKWVVFDAERRKTRFINACPECHRFESVVGATPVYLKAGVEIGTHEFVRTDLEFGSNDEKHSLILCGQSAAHALQAARLAGLDLIEFSTDI